MAVYKAVSGLEYFSACRPIDGATEPPPEQMPMNWLLRKPLEDEISLEPHKQKGPPYTHTIAQAMKIPKAQLVRLVLMVDEATPNPDFDIEFSIDLIPEEEFYQICSAPNLTCPAPPKNVDPRVQFPWDVNCGELITVLPEWLEYHWRIFRGQDQYQGHRAKDLMNFAFKAISESQQQEVSKILEEINEEKASGQTDYAMTPELALMEANNVGTKDILEFPDPEDGHTVGFLRRMARLSPAMGVLIILFAEEFTEGVARYEQREWFRWEFIENIHGRREFFEKRQLSDLRRSKPQPIKLWKTGHSPDEDKKKKKKPVEQRFSRFYLFQQVAGNVPNDDLKKHVQELNNKYNLLLSRSKIKKIRETYLMFIKNTLFKLDSAFKCQSPWGQFLTCTIQEEEQLFSTDDLDSGVDDGFPIFTDGAPCADLTGMNNMDPAKSSRLNDPDDFGDGDGDEHPENHIFIRAHQREYEISLLLARKLHQHLFYKKQVETLLTETVILERPTTGARARTPRSMFLRDRSATRKDLWWVAEIKKLCDHLTKTGPSSPTLKELVPLAKRWKLDVFGRLTKDAQTWVQRSASLVDAIQQSKKQLYTHLASDVAQDQDQTQTETDTQMAEAFEPELLVWDAPEEGSTSAAHVDDAFCDKEQEANTSDKAPERVMYFSFSPEIATLCNVSYFVCSPRSQKPPCPRRRTPRSLRRSRKSYRR